MRESNFHIMASRSTVVEKHVKTLFQRDDFFTLIKCFSYAFCKAQFKSKNFHVN